MSVRIKCYAPTLLGLLVALPATGQETSTEEKKVEKIEIVGSRIKRSELEGPQQIIRIDRDEIIKSGYNSLGDVLRDLPQNSFGSFVASGTNQVTPSLRGVGSTNTLILLNGHRMPKDADNERADISIIPVEVIQEVQILLGGASAIYGSDALGGVINIITKKEFDGALLSGGYTGTKLEGDEETVLSTVWGTSSEKSNTISMIQFRKVEPLFWSDRDWTNNTAQFGIGSPAAYQGESGQSYAISPCVQEDPLRPTVCGADWAPTWNYFQGDVEQITGMSQYRRSLNENHEFVADLFLVQKKIEQSNTANFLRGDLVPVALLGDQANLPEAPNIVGDNQVRATGFIDLAGPRTSTTRTSTVYVGTGFKGTLTDTLDYDTYVSIADNLVTSENKNALLEEELFELMEEGRYNPFAPVGQQGTLDPAITNLYGQNRSSTTTFDASVSGELVEAWAGPVEFAVGVNHIQEDFKVDDGQLVNPSSEGEFRIFGFSGTNREASRKVNSAFTEVILPLSEDFKLTSAVRSDNYSDVGEAVTPAFALEYRPTNSLLIRTSYVEGFKAPSLQDINSPLVKGFGFGRDYLKCGEPSDADEGYCQRTQPLETFSGGNKELDPETSQTISLGFSFDATDNFSITGDYYQIEITDEIGNISIDDILRFESEGRAVPGVTITRDPTADNQLVSIVSPLLNLATTVNHGWDLGIDYRIDTGVGRFALANNLAVKTVAKFERAPGLGFEDQGRENPKWRNTASTTWSLGSNAISLTNRHFDAVREKADQTGKVPSYNVWDLNYTYRFWTTSRVSIGGTNILQKRKPVDDSTVSGLSRGITQALYGIKGPSYYIQTSIEI
ncbi:MAG: TonB-dependent receptor [Pseudobacteriovorax sp.]|nr:TonB-dependent receptor [Pseudobacteriovorax sp.]